MSAQGFRLICWDISTADSEQQTAPQSLVFTALLSLPVGSSRKDTYCKWPRADATPGSAAPLKVIFQHEGTICVPQKLLSSEMLLL